MILRRIASAFKRQDWATVIIEFLLVIAGVLIALQVNNWNAARSDRTLEQQYLIRLHDEIYISDQALQERYRYKLSISNDLDYVVRYFHGLAGNQNPTNIHCRALQQSHRFSDPEADLPVVSELMATGHLDLIEDNDLRAAISTLLLAQEQRVDLLRDIQSQRAVLSSDFPDLIKFTTTPEGFDLEDDMGHKCDFGQMTQDQHFKNMALDNISRHNAYMQFWAQEMAAYENLHRLTDNALGFDQSHQEDPQ